MEQLAAVLASFVGWIDTSTTIINLNTGMTIEAVDGGKVVVTYPSGDEDEFEGEDATAILDRAVMFSSIGDTATRIIKANADQIAAAQGVPAA